jgi:tripartite-type tricarboxylate transporter receptor subunit TctC
MKAITSSVTRRALCLGLFAVAAAGSAFAQAPSYPAKPVRVVVPFAPGGATDVVARSIGEAFQARTGQAMVIDNKPGASSVIGADQVAKAAPDGYTILVSGSSTYSVVPALKPQLPYDYQKDFALLGIVAKAPLVLVTGAGTNARNFAEMVALAKKSPGALSYATFGPGSAPHLSGEMLAHEAGIKLLPVPYRGSAQASMALISGEVSVGIDTLASALPHIKSGKLRALAVVDAQRVEALSDVPTLTELGLPKATFEAWYGVAAPAKTPAPVLQQLARQLAAIMADPAVKDRLRSGSLQPVWLDAEAFQAKVQSEVAAYGAVAKRNNITLD